MNDKTQQLLDRTFNFGVGVLKFLKKLPDDHIYRIPKIQVGRAAGSVGANYEEAQGAASKRDFSHKVGICYRESRESVYWLRILSQLYEDEIYKAEFIFYIREAQELKSIFAAIKKSSNN